MVKRLSVLIPVYNEAATLPTLLQRVLEANTAGVEKEVIVVDDGSTDRTATLLAAAAQESPNLRVLTHPRNLGKGAAIRTALEVATGEAVLVQDGDLEYDPADYFHLLAPMLQEQAPVVYGSRFAETSRGSRSGYRFFYWGNRFLTWCANLLYGAELTDLQTCYKLIDAELLRELAITSDGFSLDPEITAKLLRRRIRIREVPISYRARTRREGKKVRIRDGLSALGTLFRYRWGAPCGSVPDFKVTDVLAALLVGVAVAWLVHTLTLTVGLSLAMPVAVVYILLPAGAVLGLLLSSSLGRRIPLTHELTKFGLVGLLNTAIDLGMLNLLMQATGVFSGSLFAFFKGMTFAVAVTNSYFWNRYWTFGAQGSRWATLGPRSYVRFVLVALGGLTVNVTTASLLVNVVGPPSGWPPAAWANVAAVAALTVGATWDFLGYKFVVFRQPPDRGDGQI